MNTLNPARLGLGIDAGGSKTRWALARPGGELLAEGEAEGFSALQMGNEDGSAHISAVLDAIAGAVLPVGKPAAAVAGITGLADDSAGELLAAMIAQPLAIGRAAVLLCNDMEIACRDLFAPGAGYLVYAGTGSIGAYIDADGRFHRVGGHGGILDDAGSGFWIALQALRQVWRAEDAVPGSWRQSPLASEVFARIGSSEWSASRRFLYGQRFEDNRGQIGRLALAVAATAETDPAARAILAAAGTELARLAATLLARFGPRPVVLSGRAAALHPLIEQSMRAALPPACHLQRKISEAHHAAARLAATLANDPMSPPSPTAFPTTARPCF
jgi:N-acetylglucosamine kinase-like BadF-type ATPase